MPRPKLGIATPVYCGLLNVRSHKWPCRSRNGAKRLSCLRFPGKKLNIETVKPVVTSKLQKKYPQLLYRFDNRDAFPPTCLSGFAIPQSSFATSEYNHGDNKPTFNAFSHDKYSGLKGCQHYPVCKVYFAVVKCL